MVPHSWPLHDQLASAYIRLGQPEAALQPLEESLAITGDTAHSAGALRLQGVAYRNLGRLKQAAQSLDRSLGMERDTGAKRETHGFLAEVYADLGKTELAEKHRKFYDELREHR